MAGVQGEPDLVGVGDVYSALRSGAVVGLNRGTDVLGGEVPTQEPDTFIRLEHQPRGSEHDRLLIGTSNRRVDKDGRGRILAVGSSIVWTCAIDVIDGVCLKDDELVVHGCQSRYGTCGTLRSLAGGNIVGKEVRPFNRGALQHLFAEPEEILVFRVNQPHPVVKHCVDVARGGVYVFYNSSSGVDDVVANNGRIGLSVHVCNVVGAPGVGFVKHRGCDRGDLVVFGLAHGVSVTHKLHRVSGLVG